MVFWGVFFSKKKQVQKTVLGTKMLVRCAQTPFQTLKTLKFWVFNPEDQFFNDWKGVRHTIHASWTPEFTKNCQKTTKLKRDSGFLGGPFF